MPHKNGLQKLVAKFFTRVAKQEAPTTADGLTAEQTKDVLNGRREQYGKTEAAYFEPHEEADVCATCWFFRHGYHHTEGTCKVVAGNIAWNGRCGRFYIMSLDQAAFMVESMEPVQKQVRPPTTIQSVIFDKDKFTEAQAATWLEDHDFVTEHRGKGADTTDSEIRFRQQDPGKFQDDSIKSTDLTEGVRALVGRPKREKTTKADDDEYEIVDGKRRKKKERAEKAKIYAPILKRDNAKRIVVGVVAEPDEVDTQGDTVTAEAIEKAAHNYLEKYRLASLQHTELAAATPVESYVTMDATTIGGQAVKKGAWIVAMKVNDGELWQDIEDGKYTGFSFGGYALKEIIQDNDE